MAALWSRPAGCVVRGSRWQLHRPRLTAWPLLLPALLSAAPTLHGSSASFATPSGGQRCTTAHCNENRMGDSEKPRRDGMRDTASEHVDDEDDDAESDEDDDIKLVICVRMDLGMSVGKIAAQVGHAVHDVVLKTAPDTLLAWDENGSKKIVLQIESEGELVHLRMEARVRGLKTSAVTDAGHTEVDPGATTVLAIGPAPADEIDEVTGRLSLLKGTGQDQEYARLREENRRLQEENARLREGLKRGISADL
eukprot:TRINITY_DN20694_c0_g1_i2.p1 TRINITY_DN20694_c0_g1~~TRINITY_DN20694_c0_g1_i2.p1  ORF type:complete len:273 (+),score=18.77 TRINITY_DN20694_c0_g1_i2:66-821(+)